MCECSAINTVGDNDWSVSDFLWRLSTSDFSEISKGRTGDLCWDLVTGAYLMSIGDYWTIAFFCCRLMQAVGLHMMFVGD
jgi:hypothetical protein